MPSRYLHGETVPSPDGCTVASAVTGTFLEPLESPSLQPKLPTLGCSTASTISDRMSHEDSLFYWIWSQWPVNLLGTVLSLIMRMACGSTAVVMHHSLLQEGQKSMTRRCYLQ
ncbi:hypothetical protein BDA96_04G288400 [Sorghum bicolor]|uniref:Uncharacterized protein n=1 Tax=Sorghum bicolor TaxID=4558 RepID=A0A921UM76_SORBI|nr:hypothetical protein BDA96_04G288400 [Sorghum bicolor]